MIVAQPSRPYLARWSRVAGRSQATTSSDGPGPYGLQKAGPGAAETAISEHSPHAVPPVILCADAAAAFSLSKLRGRCRGRSLPIACQVRRCGDGGPALVACPPCAPASAATGGRGVPGSAAHAVSAQTGIFRSPGAPICAWVINPARRWTHMTSARKPWASAVGCTLASGDRHHRGHRLLHCKVAVSPSPPVMCISTRLLQRCCCVPSNIHHCCPGGILRSYGGNPCCPRGCIPMTSSRITCAHSMQGRGP